MLIGMEKAKPQLPISCSPLFFISFFIISFQCSLISAQTANTMVVPVGVILDLSLEIGRKTSVLMAWEDFYKQYPNYSTRVNFTFWDDMSDPSETAYIASYLTGYLERGAGIGNAALMPGRVSMKGERKVEAIIAPLDPVLVSICNWTQVPLISFTTFSDSSISPENYSILIRATLNYSSEFLPIVDLINNFKWYSVVIVYEAFEYDVSIFQSLLRNLNDAGVAIYQSIHIPRNPSDSQIEGALQLMMRSTIRLFLVHVVSPLAIRIFELAEKLGMMSEGYIWIVTSSVGDILGTLEPAILSSMNGVVGFRTNEQSDGERKRLMDFSKRYKARLQKDYNITVSNPNMYQLWIYDAAWAVAMAVEKTKILDPSFAVPPLTGSLEKLTNAILNTNFSEGLAGNFSLVGGQRQFSTYEVVNVVDNVVTVIGNWTQNSRIYTELKKARWPGKLAKPPKSSTYSTQALKIGIPVNSTFNGTLGNFSMSVFIAARDLLPKQCNYTTVVINSTSNQYKDLADAFQRLQLDGIVGDIIIPDEAQAKFTRPYMEGGVQMVVRIKKETSSMNMWMVFRPFTFNLWLLIIAFFVFTGLAIWVTEHRVNPNYGADGSSGVEHSFIKQLCNTLYSAFSTPFYVHDHAKSNLSRFLLIIWLFVVFALAATYNASLSAILTVEKLKPVVNSLDDLKQSGVFVGCQEGSIVCDLLKTLFSFSESQVRSLRTDEYADALKKGSSHGGVSAIFDVDPYLKVFLNQSQNRCNFTTVGPTYQSNGFGFTFKDPFLLSDLSQAFSSNEVSILKSIFLKNGSDCGNEESDNESHAVSFTSFGGVFIISGVVSSLMVIISLIRYVHKNKNHLKNTLRDNNMALRDRISALWKNFLSSESSEASIVGTNRELPQSETELVHSTNQGPRTEPPEGVSPVEIQEIKRGR